MFYSILIITTVISVLISEMYFIGKYISIKQEMFAGNIFASFVIGFILYFVISFGVFFIFVFFSTPIIYFIIFFTIKDVIQILFLWAKRETFKGTAKNIKEILLSIFFAVGLTCFFNFVTPLFEQNTTGNILSPFQTWYKFQEVISKLATINIEIIYKWFGAFLIGILGFTTVMSFTNNFTKRNYWWTYIFAFIVCSGMLVGFSFGQTMQGLAGPFLVLFALMTGINIIIYSRRRYAVIFGWLSFTAWTYDPEYFFVFLIIAFSILVIYTLMKKPKISLFWVQLMAPLAIVSTFWINNYSKPLALIITAIAILAYAFIVSVGRVKMLDKLNNFFIKMRYLLPILLFLIIITTSIVIGIINTPEIKNAMKNATYLFDIYKNNTVFYIEIALFTSITLTLFSLLFYWILTKKKFLKIHLSIAAIFIIILFTLNPWFWMLIKNTILEPQFKYLSFAVLPPLVIMTVAWLPRINKKIIYA